MMKQKISSLKEKVGDWWKRLEKRDKVLMLAFLGIVPIVLYFVKIQPLREEVLKLYAKEENLKNKLMILQEEKRQIGKLKNNFKRLEKISKEAEKYLPSKKEISTLLTQISREQEKFNVTISELKAEKEIISQNIYAKVPFKMIISGTFRNTMLFLDNLRQKKRLLNIESITFEKKEKSLLTKCQISTYRFLTKKEIENLSKKKLSGKKK